MELATVILTMLASSPLIGDVVEEKELPKGAIPGTDGSANTPAKNFAAEMALSKARSWTMSAEMLILHRELIAALDKLYETWYGHPPPQRRRMRTKRPVKG